MSPELTLWSRNSITRSSGARTGSPQPNSWPRCWAGQRRTHFGHFDVIELDNGVSLEFADVDGLIQPQHYAFLISEADFDAVISRIKDRGLEYWADPTGSRLGEINHNDGGRGVYFRDPDDHYLEVITRPYGSGGSAKPCDLLRLLG